MDEEFESDGMWEEDPPLLAEIIIFAVTTTWGACVWARETWRRRRRPSLPVELGMCSNDEIDKLS